MSERFFRAVLYHIRARERQLLRGLRRQKDGWLSRILHADMLRLTHDTLCRGFAIGMFWGFAPMPFQMAPAAFFCWLARANLPAAILCVWISNPFTYAPIFFAEYQIGLLITGGEGISWSEFQLMSRDDYDGDDNPVAVLLQEIGEPLLLGSLAASTVMAVIGYGIGALLFRRIKNIQQRRRRKKLAAAAATHAHPR